MNDGWLVVKNFEKFQHYKDRNPPWIKLHSTLLFDYEFHALPDKSKAHLMLIWLLVSNRHDRRIPNDERWVAQKIGATDKVDLGILIDSGWLISLAGVEAPRYQDASNMLDQRQSRDREREREETETEGWLLAFDGFYSEYPRHEGKADALKAWKALKPTDFIQHKIALDLKRFANVAAKFIPLPASYLRGRRWEDERPAVVETAGNFGNSGMANLARHLGDTYEQNGNGKTADAREGELVSTADRRPDHRDVGAHPKTN